MKELENGDYHRLANEHLPEVLELVMDLRKHLRKRLRKLFDKRFSTARLVSVLTPIAAVHGMKSQTKLLHVDKHWAKAHATRTDLALLLGTLASDKETEQDPKFHTLKKWIRKYGRNIGWKDLAEWS